MKKLHVYVAGLMTLLLCGCNIYNPNTITLNNNLTTLSSSVGSDNTQVYVYGCYDMETNEISIGTFDGVYHGEKREFYDDNIVASKVVSNKDKIYVLLENTVYFMNNGALSETVKLEKEDNYLIGCNEKYLFFYNTETIGRYDLNNSVCDNAYVKEEVLENPCKVVVTDEDLVISVYDESGEFEKVEIYNDSFENGKVTVPIGNSGTISVEEVNDTLPSGFSLMKNPYIPDDKAISLMKKEETLMNVGLYRFDEKEDFLICHYKDNNLRIYKDGQSDTLSYSGGRLSIQDDKAVIVSCESDYKKKKPEDRAGALYSLGCPKEYWVSDKLTVYDLSSKSFSKEYGTKDYRILGYDARNDFIYLFDVSDNTVKRLNDTNSEMTDIVSVDESDIIRFWWCDNVLTWIYENNGSEAYGGYVAL